MDDSVVSAISGLGLIVAGAAIGHIIAAAQGTKIINKYRAGTKEKYSKEINKLLSMTITSAFLISGEKDPEAFNERLRKEMAKRYDVDLKLTVRGAK